MKPGIKIWRDKHGVPHVEGKSETDLFWGQGYVHARDRGLQMLLMRIIGQGRVCEILDPGDDSLAIDRFFRRMNWTGGMDQQEERFSSVTRNRVDAYCNGANAAFSRRIPWELKLLGYTPESWTVADTLLISRMMGYLTLSQSQGEMERLIVEMVQGGIDIEKLEALFPGLLEGLDPDLIRSVQLGERIVPPDILWGTAVARMTASNNWVVSGGKSRSGQPILCSDPHLEVNRLPNIWCELVMRTPKRYIMGASVPGGPGILIGRNPDLAWGVTYAFADMTDSWIEQCRDGACFRGNAGWKPFVERKEMIHRKGKSPVPVVFFENEHGVLDGNPHKAGFYLASRWSGADSGADSLDAVTALWDAQTAEDGMAIIGRVETAWNFVFADTAGNIGYRMTGKIPCRREGVSGLIPLPGWKDENDWRGFVSPEKLPRILNPKTGYFVTANNDLNHYGEADPINLPMGPYRADRIEALLKDRDDLIPDDMAPVQQDVYSLQAEVFMKILLPLLPDTESGRLLREWDCRYTAKSRGATLFEAFYAALFQNVFGLGGVGNTVIDYLQKETGVFIDFYHNFDRVLLAESSPWLGNRTREAVYREALTVALTEKPRPWGDTRIFHMNHILFGSKLPAVLGFDRGPLTGKGNRATVHQGQIYRSAGRETSFMPSLRMITDMATDECRTNMIGGPVDRRFSRWYCSDLKNWLSGTYKILSPDSKRPRFSLPWR